MAVLHRALLSWFLGLVFLILLVIRLDQRTQWNWFIVFIPMWIFDGAVLIYAAFYLVNRCRSTRNHAWTHMVIRKKIEFVCVIGFKLALQILICLKLEFPSWNLPLYFVFIPLWCILLFLIINLFVVLLEIALDVFKDMTWPTWETLMFGLRKEQNRAREREQREQSLVS
jgi:hypothetical protein